VDERVPERLATDEISIGDYVLTGGELAAMVIIDAVARLLPGVLAPGSTAEESHTGDLLEYPQYTRPPDFRGWRVPEVLLSGNHEAVGRWRRKEALRRTRERRPDLLARAELSALDRTLLAELAAEEAAQRGVLLSGSRAAADTASQRHERDVGEGAGARMGDRVRLLILPPWTAQVPPETQEVLRRCVGRVFTVREINDHGHLELWVHNGRDRKRIVGADIIFVEPEYCEVVAGQEGTGL
jgi:hypothetical protein